MNTTTETHLQEVLGGKTPLTTDDAHHLAEHIEHTLAEITDTLTKMKDTLLWHADDPKPDDREDILKLAWRIEGESIDYLAEKIALAADVDQRRALSFTDVLWDGIHQGHRLLVRTCNEGPLRAWKITKQSPVRGQRILLVHTHIAPLLQVALTKHFPGESLTEIDQLAQKIIAGIHAAQVQ